MPEILQQKDDNTTGLVRRKSPNKFTIPCYDAVNWIKVEWKEDVVWTGDPVNLFLGRLPETYKLGCPKGYYMDVRVNFDASEQTFHEDDLEGTGFVSHQRIHPSDGLCPIQVSLVECDGQDYDLTVELVPFTFDITDVPVPDEKEESGKRAKKRKRFKK